MDAAPGAHEDVLAASRQAPSWSPARAATRRRFWCSWTYN